MNIVVLSPSNRGVGVSSVAHILATELMHRGEFVQLMDVNHNRPSYMNMYKSVKAHEGEEIDGMANMIQFIRTETINADDMKQCAIDLGVPTICVTPSITDDEVKSIVSVTKNCQIDGRTLYTVIDMNIEDSHDELFKYITTNANICIFVLTQDVEHIHNINQCRQLNDQALREHKIHTAYVVNRFEECALSLKDIWANMNVKDTKCWFKVRYNEHILQTKSKGLYTQFSKALRESNDTDVAKVKADIAKVASYVLSKH